MGWQWNVSLFALNVGFLLLGGYVFSELERVAEDTDAHIATNLTLVYDQFLANHSCMSAEDLQQLVGILSNEFNKTIPAHWDFINAIFFSATVVTTIGYGNVTPKTQGGRIFFIFYALLGIPLMLVFLAQVGVGLQAAHGKIWAKVRCIKNKRVESALQMLLLLGVAILFLIAVPAIVFRKINGWTFEESLYYSVTTLSTVGFGDYIPFDNAHNSSDLEVLYRICVMAWVILGLAWFAGIISAAQGALEDRLEDAKELIEKVEEKVEKHIPQSITDPLSFLNGSHDKHHNGSQPSKSKVVPETNG